MHVLHILLHRPAEWTLPQLLRRPLAAANTHQNKLAYPFAPVPSAPYFCSKPTTSPAASNWAWSIQLSRVIRPAKAPSWASISDTSAAVQLATCAKLVTPRPLSRVLTLGPKPLISSRFSGIDDTGAGLAAFALGAGCAFAFSALALGALSALAFLPSRPLLWALFRLLPFEQQAWPQLLAQRLWVRLLFSWRRSSPEPWPSSTLARRP